MQLKIRRSQRMGGVMGNTPVFCVDARAEFTSQELSDIQRYKLGKEILYDSKAAQKHKAALGENRGVGDLDITSGASLAGAAGNLARGAFSLAAAKLSLTITIDSIQRGQRIECKDLQEVMGAEEAIGMACEGLRSYLDTAVTFDGREVIVDYSGAEPRITQGVAPPVAQPLPAAPPMIEGSATETLAAPSQPIFTEPSPAVRDLPDLRPQMPESTNSPADRFVYWFNSLTSAQKVGVGVGALVVIWILSKIL